jgi:hypothetical protein
LSFVDSISTKMLHNVRISTFRSSSGDDFQYAPLALGKKNREPRTEPKEPRTGTERTGTEKFGSCSVPISGEPNYPGSFGSVPGYPKNRENSPSNDIAHLKPNNPISKILAVPHGPTRSAPQRLLCPVAGRPSLNPCYWAHDVRSRRRRHAPRRRHVHAPAHAAAAATRTPQCSTPVAVGVGCRPHPQASAATGQ